MLLLLPRFPYPSHTSSMLSLHASSLISSFFLLSRLPSYPSPHRPPHHAFPLTCLALKPLPSLNFPPTPRLPSHTSPFPFLSPRLTSPIRPPSHVPPLRHLLIALSLTPLSFLPSHPFSPIRPRLPLRPPPSSRLSLDASNIYLHIFGRPAAVMGVLYAVHRNSPTLVISPSARVKYTLV